MFYGHTGNATDNAFTTYNGSPTRSFVWFNTKKEREEAQDKIWRESGHETNLIFCGRKLLEEYLGKDFVPLSNGSCMSAEGYEAYLQEQQV